MAAQDSLERFYEWVWEDVRKVDYPSTPMLDRLERNLRSPEEAAEYVALLVDKAGDDYKSPMMMARAERMARKLSLLQRLQELQEEAQSQGS